MGLYLALSGEYARRVMVGTVGKSVATQPLSSGGQLCIGATTSSNFFKSLGWDFRENQDVSTTLVLF